MGSGPSKEQQERLIAKGINSLPAATTDFPGYYGNEVLFLENKAKILEYCSYISKIGGYALEKFEIPYVSSSLDFLLSYFSVESALLAMKIEQNVINHLNALIRSKLVAIKELLPLLQANDLKDSERTGYIINGVIGCQEIANLFSDKESHLFKNPLASAPILVNLVPVYINLLVRNYAETKSQTVRDDLFNKVKTFKSTVESHMYA